MIALDAAAVFECDCCAYEMPLELGSYVVLIGDSQVWTFVCSPCAQVGSVEPLWGLCGDVWIKPVGKDFWVHHFIERPEKKIYRARKTSKGANR